MLKNIFKYKWTDLFWILFVVLTCLCGNHDLFPLNHQNSLLDGSF